MEKKIITVTALNRYLKYRFDQDDNLKDIRLKAEISNYTRHSRGHLYFSLKDETSQIRAVMFAQQAQKLKFEPKEGSKVVIEGYVTVYEPSGQYQVFVNNMSEEGLGDLYQAFERLKVKLSEAGYFNPLHKKPIPAFPKTIGVITSPTGAAVRDIINIINRRYPIAKIIVYPALVQGEEAKYSIVKMIEKANRDQLCDVLIVGRGGGSIEDLWAFNEEIVAKAIYDSRLPIISAVGHETDTTIADFVADLRSPTPSGAAEIVVPDQKTLLDTVSVYLRKLNLLINRSVESEVRHLNTIMNSFVFTNPGRIIEKQMMQLIHLQDRLTHSRPDKLLNKAQENLTQNEKMLDNYFQNYLMNESNRFINLTEKLELLNPLNLMKKGYAVVKKQGVIQKTIQNLAVNDFIDVSMADGTVTATIEAIKKGE